LEIRREGYPPVTTKRFKLIDMGQMFGNFNWTAASAGAPHASYTLPAHLAATLTRAKLQPGIQALQAVGDQAVRDCFAECPEEWNIPTVDREAGAARCISAAAQIDQILRTGNPGIQ
jgi:hypothetical protein